ncbi:hypothetical protein BZL29_3472 [Mycobacterium kansasii]|uniref:Uncharacterized protein n=1 Tax=Mycobacterium kansasii TaxID=1768 RepID=A0A1V3XDY3_MYCKA|nr:hypothetical protein BZL29_3472 [Mycobacterium kansasii]
MSPAPQAPLGMFARISPAGVVAAPAAAPPAGEGPASAQLSEALQSRAGALTPPGSGLGPGVVSGYPGAGLTSYIRPTGDGFKPSAVQRPGSGTPAGMLTAAALRSPVATAPSSTATVQPLAYVHPQLPRPSGPSSPSPLLGPAAPPTPSTPHPHRNLRHPRRRPPTGCTARRPAGVLHRKR